MTGPILIPKYLTRAIEEQQQRQQIANLGLQDVLNIAADYVAELTSLTRAEVIQQYRFDGTAFVLASEVEASPKSKEQST